MRFGVRCARGFRFEDALELSRGIRPFSRTSSATPRPVSRASLATSVAACVADVRVERGDEADGVLDLGPQQLAVGGDAATHAWPATVRRLAEVRDA